MTWTVLVTALTGSVAGYLFHRFRLPGGALVGSMIAVGVLHVSVTGLEPIARDVRVAAQIMVGIMIGATIKKEPLKLLRRYVPQILLVLAVVLGAAAASGLLLVEVAGLDLLTGLLATVPGGAADVTAAALDLNSDVAVVAAFQLIRQLTIFIIIAMVFGKALDRRDVPPGED